MKSINWQRCQKQEVEGAGQSPRFPVFLKRVSHNITLLFMQTSPLFSMNTAAAENSEHFFRFQTQIQCVKWIRKLDHDDFTGGPLFPVVVGMTTVKLHKDGVQCGNAGCNNSRDSSVIGKLCSSCSL